MTIDSDGAKVQWTNTVDSRGVDLSSDVTVAAGLVSVDTANLPASWNDVATVQMKDVSCGTFTLWHSDGFVATTAGLSGLADLAALHKQTSFVSDGKTFTLMADVSNLGGDCTDDTVCKNVQCNNGVLSFEAQHFDSFFGGAGTYTSDDLTAAVISGAGKFVISFLPYIGAIVLFIIVLAGYVAMKKLRR
jgi:hypothetical protein